MPSGKHLGGDFCLGLVVLIMCRVLQGLSAGGEIGAVVAYLMEASPVGSVGMAVSMIGVGAKYLGARQCHGGTSTPRPRF